MAVSAFTVANIKPSLGIDANQRFIFGLEEAPEPLGSFKLDNNFTPIIGTPSNTNFEVRNKAFSGYRWIHTTTSTDTYGTYKLQKFLTASPTGIDIMTFNNDGTFIIPGVNDAKYIIQTATTNLPNAQSLGALTTGIVKNTVTTETGVLSIAVAGTDYATLSNRLDQFASPNVSLNLNSQKIINLLDPTNPQDAATKTYVDSKGISIADAKFIIQTADADLPNAQILGSLTTGLLKNTTTTGVLSIGVAGTDYYSLNNPTKLIDNAVSQNVSMGRQALQSITSGTGNAIFGGCGLSITTGSTNSIFGSNSGNSITTGSSNAIFGGSGETLTTGNTNTFMGGGGQQVTTSSFNVFLGSESGGNLQTGSGRNVGIGVQAGLWNVGGFATYDNCIFIGNQATAGALNLTNSVAIGSGTTVLTSNSMVLGNGLNVGIGLNNPTLAKLIVSGGPTNVASENSVIRALGSNNATKIEIENNSGSGKLYELRSDNAGAFSIFDRSGVASRLFITSGGLIGINTTSPTTAQLVVNGGVANVASEDSSFRVTGSSNATKIEINNSTVSTGKLYELRSDNAGAFSIFDRTAAASRMFVNTSGNIGLNMTASILAKLHVTGGVQNITNEDTGIRISSSSNSSKLELQCTNGSGKLYELQSYNNGALIFFDRGAAQTRLLINSSGQIGINTVSPTTAQLVVSGGVQNVASEDSCIRATSSSNSAKIEVQCTNGSGKLYELHSTNAGAFIVYDRSANNSKLFINASGQVALGSLLTPHAQLQFPNVVTNRQLVLYEAANNDFQFHGFGSISGGLGYNINDVGDSHVFFAGVNTTTRNEIARFTGTGDCAIADTYYGKRPSGTCYMQANATGTAVTGGVWTKVAGTTSSASLNKFTMPTDNKLQYTATRTINAFVIVSVSSSHNIGAGALIGFSLFKNGVQVVPSAMFNQDVVSTTKNTTFSTIVSLATNDYIEVFCNSSVNGTITVSHLTIDVTTT